ncbi:hypothetical protein [Paenibacillus sp. FSL E2-0177]|uniref:LytR/AlgR family response regulator transcription factor n=3 Tax=Paenibacillus TaxID=44249 RepID=UPI0030EEC861
MISLLIRQLVFLIFELFDDFRIFLIQIIKIQQVKIGDLMVVGRYMDRIRAIEPLRTTPAGTVFWDIQMLGLRGTSAARKIRTIMPQARIVFTTAYSEYTLEAFEIQSIDYKLYLNVKSVRMRISASTLYSVPRGNFIFICRIPKAGNYHGKRARRRRLTLF